MVSITIPYVLPMLIGMSYDYNRASVGESIFSRATVDANKVWTDHSSIDYKYMMIQSDSDETSLLDVNAELSLKVMADLVNIQGSGSYLKKTEDRSNSVEYLCRLKFETGSERLPSEAAPRSGWEGNVGFNTHFARTITYGGELVASLKFTAIGNSDVADIKAQLRASVGIEGTLDATVAGKLHKLTSESTSSMALSISYYATTPVTGVAQDMESFAALIDSFADETSNVNGGKGNPIRMELVPLRTLQGGSSLPSFLRNSALTSQMDSLRTRYMDLLVARSELNAWVTRLVNIPEASIPKIETHLTDVEDLLQIFYVAVSNMDVREEASAGQFDNAFAQYVAKGLSGFNLPDKFVRAYRQLKQDVESDILAAQDCFSTPLVNVGMLRANMIDSADSQTLPGHHSMTTCKAQCMLDDDCKSITFVKGLGGLVDQPSAQNTCYINFVEVASDSVFPDVLRAGTDVYIITRLPDCPKV